MNKLITYFITTLFSLVITNSNAQVFTDPSTGDSVKTRIGLMGIDGGSISKVTLLNTDRLSFIDESIDSAYRVISFQLTIHIAGYEPVKFHNKVDGQITDEMKNALQMALPESKVYFEYVMYKDVNGEIKKAWPASFVIDK